MWEWENEFLGWGPSGSWVPGGCASFAAGHFTHSCQAGRVGFLGLNLEKVFTLLSPVNPFSPGTPSYLSFFFFLNNFIYVFIFGFAGSSLLLGLSLAAVRVHYSLLWCADLLRCLPSWWSTGSRACGLLQLWCTGFVAPWNVGSSWTRGLLPWQVGSLPPSHQGSPPHTLVWRLDPGLSSPKTSPFLLSASPLPRSLYPKLPTVTSLFAHNTQAPEEPNPGTLLRLSFSHAQPSWVLPAFLCS